MISKAKKQKPLCAELVKGPNAWKDVVPCDNPMPCRFHAPEKVKQRKERERVIWVVEFKGAVTEYQWQPMYFIGPFRSKREGIATLKEEGEPMSKSYSVKLVPYVRRVKG